VGKSTLINCLAGRKALAKVSSTPGKTRSINFYHVAPGDFYLVDLPGYGYARRSKKEREQWSALVEAYMAGNTLLNGVALLLDCKIPPQTLDLDLIAYVQAKNIPILAVLTKADKCKQAQRQASVKSWKQILKHGEPILFSGKTGTGKQKLWDAIYALAGIQL